MGYLSSTEEMEGGCVAVGYAHGTKVSAENSKTEMKRVVYKNGCANYQYVENEERAMVMFTRDERVIRFIVSFPPPEDRMFTKTPTGRRRSASIAYKEYEAETRRRWRALILCLKAKFEIVESGIASFETEFMPYMMLPDKRTVAEAVAPLIEEAYKTKRMPRLALLPE